MLKNKKVNTPASEVMNLNRAFHQSFKNWQLSVSFLLKIKVRRKRT